MKNKTRIEFKYPVSTSDNPCFRSLGEKVDKIGIRIAEQTHFDNPANPFSVRKHNVRYLIPDNPFYVIQFITDWTGPYLNRLHLDNVVVEYFGEEPSDLIADIKNAMTNDMLKHLLSGNETTRFIEKDLMVDDIEKIYAAVKKYRLSNTIVEKAIQILSGKELSIRERKLIQELKGENVS